MSSSEGLALLAGEVYGRIDDRQRPMPSENGQHAVRVLVVAPGRLHREGLAMLLGAGRTWSARPVPRTRRSRCSARRRRTRWSSTSRPAAWPRSGRSPVRRRSSRSGRGATAVWWRPAPRQGWRPTPTSTAASTRCTTCWTARRAASSCARRRSLASTLLGALARGAPPSPRLTPRESEILALVDQGLSNKAIAARLQIRLATVKNHIHNVLEKLQVDGRAAAAARAREAGLSPPRALG
jgi:DNA-binding CsgD family transcriptional regulator